MIMLLLSGISLAATAISWWNGVRQEKVNDEIEILEAKLDAIYAADENQRAKLMAPYLSQLANIFAQELSVRDEITSELHRANAQAQKVIRQRFGPRESAGFRKMVLEIELAMGRLEAERAWLTHTGNYIRTLIGTNPRIIPTVEWLDLPPSFPHEGLILPFNGKPPSYLHDYRLQVADSGGSALIYAVDHVERTAWASNVRAQLLQAAQGAQTLTASVVRREARRAELSFQGAVLSLPLGRDEGQWLEPGDELEVWPDGWTLSDMIAYDKWNTSLPVRLYPQVAAFDEYWWPVALGIEESQIEHIKAIWQNLQTPELNDRPWHIYLRPNGDVVFRLGPHSLITVIDIAHRCFRLKAVAEDVAPPDSAVRCYVALTPNVLGSADEELDPRNRFMAFVQALSADFEIQRSAAMQQDVALYLRKLSLIYREQYAYLAQRASCGFLPGSVECNGKTVTGTLCEIIVPDWLKESVHDPGMPRLRVVGHNRCWRVSRFSLIDERAGVCQIELAIPRNIHPNEIDAFNLFRLERVTEGDQRQTLSAALEKAILGQFASPDVHQALFTLNPEANDEDNQGQEAVVDLLHSSEPVVAIWGPPGAGKTTTLVNWLMGLFPEGQEAGWPRVLLTGPTHVAVSNLLEGLLDKAPHLRPFAVRYGSEDKISDGMTPYWHAAFQQELQQGNGQIDEVLSRQWNELMGTRKGKEAATHWLFRGKRIHGATCTGMANRDFGLMRDAFDIVIVDEAGKALAAELMLPASIARRLILVGDHNQLPPTVTEEALDNRIGYTLPVREVKDLLKKNFFQELYEGLPGAAKGMLTVQYRMHRDIGDLVSALFYDGCLESHRSGGDWDLMCARVVFVDFSAMPNYRHRKRGNLQTGVGSSLENSTERAALHQILRGLNQRCRHIDRTLSVLVVCPYKAQREAVASETAGQRYAFDLSVATVDAVQGGEADVVLLLMTRISGHSEFLLDRHRINVALSRAREAVVVLGSVSYLARNADEPMADLIEKGKRFRTLKLLELPENARFARDLVPKLLRQRETVRI